MTGRRKRPNVPESSRKRVAVACNACRKVKEKCLGGHPCSRCKRLGRECELQRSSDRAKCSSYHTLTSEPACAMDSHPVMQGDEEDRLRALERIVTYFTGVVDLSTSKVLGLAHNLPARAREVKSIDLGLLQTAEHRHEVVTPPIPSQSENNVSHLSAMNMRGLSHHNFLNTLQQKIDEQLHGSQNDPTLPRPYYGSSRPDAKRPPLFQDQNLISDAVAAVPPQGIAVFLMQSFFDFGQTNYFYIDEGHMRGKVDFLYSQATALRSEDAAWLCTLLMLLAVGSQFAHLNSNITLGTASNPMNHDLLVDDRVSLNLYRAAVKLIPDIISLASVESVQAFLLLGMFTLPVDATSLSVTFFSSAIRIAVQNGMHCSHIEHLDASTVEIRNRIWWTAFTLERRVCVLHGLPVSIARRDVSTYMPSDSAAPLDETRVDILPNFTAMIRLTSFLEKARDAILHTRRFARTAGDPAITAIMHIKQDLSDYWRGLPAKICCKDLTPGRPFFRSNIHLTLTYHLVHVFIGRNFIFAPSHSEVVDDKTTWEELRELLVTACVSSAIEIVELCRILRDQVGLARASYTEFTSCRAALLVILARRTQERSSRLEETSSQAMTLLKHMSLGFYSAEAEKRQLEALDLAVQRLNHHARFCPSDEGKGDSNSMRTPYDQFRDWASLWTQHENPAIPSPRPLVPDQVSQVYTEGARFSFPSPFQDLGWDACLPISAFDFEIQPSFEDL